MPEPVGPENQHGNIRLRGGADPLEDDQHLLVAADHFAEALDRRRLIFGADRRAPLEELDRAASRCRDFPAGPRRSGPACRAAPRATPNADELADAVLDVQPEPAERLHQRVGVEAFFGPGAQIAKDAGAKRALDQVPEPGVEIALGLGPGGGRAAS